jgi:hypothetical protein
MAGRRCSVAGEGVLALLGASWAATAGKASYTRTWARKMPRVGARFNWGTQAGSPSIALATASLTSA